MSRSKVDVFVYILFAKRIIWLCRVVLRTVSCDASSCQTVFIRIVLFSETCEAVAMSEKASKKPVDPVTDVPVDHVDHVDPVARARRVDALSKNHILMAMGVGLVPLPVVDLVGVVAVQLDLIKKISTEYGVPFREDRSKAILS